MKTKKMILPMVCCIPLMSSCATDKPMEKPAWNIQPVYKVNNVAADNPNALYQLGRYYQGQRRYHFINRLNVPSWLFYRFVSSTTTHQRNATNHR